MKSSVEEIRRRFDSDVDRFSNLETGQSATMDAPVALELVSRAAHAATPEARHLLDIGCGAGNFALRFLSFGFVPAVTLIDLSKPMLDRAAQRIEEVCSVTPKTFQVDIREYRAGHGSVDVILAGAVLHHLRTDTEWEGVFDMMYHSLRPGGSLWIFDMVKASTPAVHDILWHRYGAYLSELRDTAYRDQVFEYIEKEDTPRSLVYQLDLLADVGFAEREVLHSNAVFAAFGGIKSR